MVFNEKQSEGGIFVPAVVVSEEPAVVPIPAPVQASNLATHVTTSVTETVQVVAPSNLAAGYHLNVNVNGQSRTVVIPDGGVVAGQTFTGALLIDPNKAPPTASPQIVAPISNDNSSFPFGSWRDGLCDCCRHGCCHAMCCFTCWFTPVVVGQIMTRMSLNWIGGRGAPPSRSNTCLIVTVLFLISVIVEGVIYPIIFPVNANCVTVFNDTTNFRVRVRCIDSDGNEVANRANSSLGIFYSVWTFIWFLYFLIILIRARLSIRNKFGIPAKCCGACEDCCCSFWCTCCTVTQMARHTNDYDLYNVQCCSPACCNKRGQRHDAPEIV